MNNGGGSVCVCVNEGARAFVAMSGPLQPAFGNIRGVEAVATGARGTWRITGDTGVDIVRSTTTGVVGRMRENGGDGAVKLDEALEEDEASVTDEIAGMALLACWRMVVRGGGGGGGEDDNDDDLWCELDGSCCGCCCRIEGEVREGAMVVANEVLLSTRGCCCCCCCVVLVETLLILLAPAR